jgi:hypothetical protein
MGSRAVNNFGKSSLCLGDVVDGAALDLKDIIYTFPNK